MTFWRKLLLVYMLAMHGPTEVKGQTEDQTTKAKLRCYRCYSTKSWEECDKQSVVDSCQGDVEGGFSCIKITVRKWEIVNRTKTDRVITDYAKYCSPSKYCSDKQCRELGWRCTVDCCNQDLCNAGVASVASVASVANVASVTNWANNVLTIAALLRLAVSNI